MRRRTLDITLSTGGALLAVLLLVAGLAFNADAQFARDTVSDQLSQQQITFPDADALSPEELAFTEARTNCLNTYSGQDLTTGKQAECYANEYIGAHLTYLATRVGYTDIASFTDGKTYSELGAVRGDLRTQIQAATDAGDEAKVAELEQQLTDVTDLRELAWQGTMHRNALLTSYGFSVLGERAATVAMIAFLGAGLLFLLSLAGFVHAFGTPREEQILAVESPQKEPAAVGR